MQFHPTALILSASAQRQHFEGARTGRASADAARWDFTRLDRAAVERPPAVETRDHRVRRSVAGLLLRAAGAVEPRSSQRAIARG